MDPTLAIVLPSVISVVGTFLTGLLMFVITRWWDHMVDRKKKRLEESTRELIVESNEVSEQVTFAGLEQQTTRQELGSWLAKLMTEIIKAEVEAIQSKLSQWRTNYGGWRRYLFIWKRLGVDLQVFGEYRKVTKLLDQEIFKDVAAKPPLPQGRMRSPLPESHERLLPPSPPRHRAAVDQELPITTRVQGMNSYLEQILLSLAIAEVKIIGIYGIGGVGKTTLLKIINNHFVHSKLFDCVIFVVASAGVKLEQLQKKIMKNLRVTLGTHGDIDSRATPLMNLLNYKKVLLLLDDLWDHVDLVRLGIPLEQGTCKVVFTTRSKSVCDFMRADKSFQVRPLGIEDAWRLFKETVGEEVIEAHPNIERLAKAVVEECGGFPLALIVIGRTMAGNIDVHEWQSALHLLRQSRLHDTLGTWDTLGIWDTHVLLPILEFSYQNLRDDGGEGPSSLDP